MKGIKKLNNNKLSKISGGDNYTIMYNGNKNMDNFSTDISASNKGEFLNAYENYRRNPSKNKCNLFFHLRKCLSPSGKYEKITIMRRNNNEEFDLNKDMWGISSNDLNMIDKKIEPNSLKRFYFQHY